VKPVLVLAIGVMAAVGCGSSSQVAPPTVATPAATSASSSATGAATTLIGEWRRINSCGAFVRSFHAAELDDLAPEALVDAAYFGRIDQVDESDPCRGAQEVVHSYFFQDTGRFGSLDDDEVLVDDGAYATVDADTITLAGPLTETDVTLDYRIVGGDTLSFRQVVVPADCKGRCREDYAWAIAAFYPGEFHRVS